MNRRSRITGPRNAAPLSALDPRTHAWRADLADVALADRLAVPNYAEAARRCLTRTEALRGEPRADAPAVSELLPGEVFAVLEVSGGWAWGYGAHDSYVGYVRADALGPGIAATHMVGWGDALVLAAPAVKAACVGHLPMGARVAAADHDERFARVDGGYVHRRHLLPLDGVAGGDAVAAAHHFLGAPYKWGGRTRAGVDCSGLVQVAFAMAGMRLGRDSDMQAAAGSPSAPKRGALAWWPGHIGVMVDERHLLHANGHWMMAVVEPLADVEARGGAPASLKCL